MLFKRRNAELAKGKNQSTWKLVPMPKNVMNATRKCMKKEKFTQLMDSNLNGDVLNSPNFKYLKAICVIAPKNKNASNLGHLKKSLRLLSMTVMLGFLGFAPLKSFAINECVWEMLAQDDVEMARKLMLFEDTRTLDTQACKQLVAAYTYYKQGDFDGLTQALSDLDTFLKQEFSKKTSAQKENLQVR